MTAKRISKKSSPKRALYAGNKGVESTVSRIRALNALAGPKTINLGLGKPSVDMPEKLRDLIDPTWLRRSMEYADNAGIPELRQRFANHYGMGVDNFMIAHGAQGATTCALLAILNPGDDVLVPDPGFLAYEKTVAMLHGKTRFYPLKKVGATFHYDAKSAIERIRPNTRAIFVCSPNNPTGSMLSDEAMIEIAAAARKVGAWVLSDEVYGELQFEQAYRPAALLAENIVSLNSLSKSHAMTGWRLGWLACQNERFVSRSIVANQYKNTGSSTPAQQLALAMFDKKGLFEEIIQDFRAEYAQSMRNFFAPLPASLKAQVEMPGGSFYAFLPAPKQFKTGDDFAKQLLIDHQILGIPGSVFGKIGKRFIRFSIAGSELNIKRAAAALAKVYS